MHLRGVGNDGEGHCAFEVAAQAFATGEGWMVDLVERAFLAGDGEQLFRMHTALRRLAVAVIDVFKNTMIIGDMTGPQVTTDPGAIQRLALEYTEPINNRDDLRNTILYMDPIGGGGGHGGMEAIRALSEGLGIDLAMGRKLDVQTEYV